MTKVKTRKRKTTEQEQKAREARKRARALAEKAKKPGATAADIANAREARALADTEIKSAAREKFKRVATPIANKALALIDRLTSIAGKPRSYLFTGNDAKEVKERFKEALSELNAAFEQSLAREMDTPQQSARTISFEE